MIKNTDRSKWIGASDTSMLFSNPNTATFKNWWAVKLGLITNDFTNKYMIAGTELEHHILDTMNPLIRRDMTFYRPKYRLRVNTDGILDKLLIEIKTTSSPVSKPSIKYWRQVQSGMFGSKRERAELIYYLMRDENYKNFYLPIDLDKLTTFKIERDNDWINNVYLPKEKYIAHCLRKRIYPVDLKAKGE